MVYRSWLLTWLLGIQHRLGQGWHQLWQWLRWLWFRPPAPPALATSTLTTASPPKPSWRQWLQKLWQKLRRFPLLGAAPKPESLPGATPARPLPIIAPSPVLPEPTLEVPSVVESYEPHWLEQLLRWLDETLYFWECKLRDFWHWLRGFLFG
ncbi:MAG: hypothetical protein NZL92_07900 [Gloeomargarita sp. SKYG116]|nr:hypothetical protein [Gloeomargarita sp. SKYG116]MCS7292548.1 hypothetical protein [Gloeomargarita sp. SKYB120]MDW8178109.1 hypothetical protein [Gloeomargarita sp. SKYBB_i_bin120]MDW8401604.1 hypothetical protein [Gloeomargarita sp. SKYGB_i_bin116]